MSTSQIKPRTHTLQSAHLSSLSSLPRKLWDPTSLWPGTLYSNLATNHGSCLPPNLIWPSLLAPFSEPCLLIKEPCNGSGPYWNFPSRNAYTSCEEHQQLNTWLHTRFHTKRPWFCGKSGFQHSFLKKWPTLLTNSTILSFSNCRKSLLEAYELSHYRFSFSALYCRTSQAVGFVKSAVHLIHSCPHENFSPPSEVTNKLLRPNPHMGYLWPCKLPLSSLDYFSIISFW